MKRFVYIIISILLLVSPTACQTPVDTAALQTGEKTPDKTTQEPGDSTQTPQTAEPSTSSGKDPAEPAKDNNEPSSEPTPPEPSPSDGSAEVERVIVGLTSTEVMKGTILDPSVTIMPAGAADKTYSISSSNESVVRQMYGFWTAVGGGSAELIATTPNGVTGSVTVTVVVPVAGITLSASEISINRGDSVMLTPIFAPVDTTEKQVQYVSDNENIARVSEDGMVHATGAGTALIRCTAGAYSATCAVTVAVPVTSISISTDRRTFEVGARGSIVVQIIPEDATDQTFSTEISGNAALLSGTDAFVCNASGDATITVTATNGVTANQTITVIDLVAYASEVFRLTNTERANAGLEPLSMMSSLTQTAVVRAKETIENFSHDRPDGRSCFTAFDENNVSYSLAGENIAMGQRTAYEVVRAWMDSVGHRENILKEEYGHLGVGVALDSSGRLYWAQNFTD